MANILADLSLRLRANSAELSKGLENAKKQVKSFQDGITTTGKAMGEAFKSASAEIGGSLNHMTNGISGMLSSGLEMSRGLVAGITSVKTAFISTGIGAIVLAIVAAFSALTAAFKRSGDAGDAMAEVFSGIRAVLDFLIGKLVDLGEWIVKAFQSEPMQKFGEVLKNIGTRFGGFFKMVIGGFQAIINSALGASFAISGIFDKDNRAKALEYFDKVKEGYEKIAEGAKQLWTGVNETPNGDGPLKQAYKDGKALEQLRDKLADDQREANVQNKKDEIEIGKLREEMAKTGSRSEEDRRKRIELANKAIEIQNGVTARNISLAKRNLDIVKKENALRNDTSDAAKDAQAAAEVAYLAAEENGRQENLRMQRMISTNEDALDIVKEKNKEQKKSVEILRAEATEAYRLKTTFEGQRDALKQLWDEGKIGAQEYADELKKIDEDEKAAKLLDNIKKIKEELKEKIVFDIDTTGDFEKITNYKPKDVVIDGFVKLNVPENVEIPTTFDIKGDIDPKFLDAFAQQFKDMAFSYDQLLESAMKFGNEAMITEARNAKASWENEKTLFDERTKNFSETNKNMMLYADAYKRENIKTSQEVKEAKARLSEEEFAIYKEENDKKIALYNEATQYIIQKDNEEYTTRWENRSNYIELVSDSINVIRDLTEAAYNTEVAQAKKRGASEEELEKIRVKYARKQKAMAIAQAIMNGALAITNLIASVPGSVINPATWAGIAVAGATTAAQVALIASQPLAKGGIAYGETLATIGEYPGAQSNPEVVAPLDKLQNILTQVISEKIDFDKVNSIDESIYSEKNLRKTLSQRLPKIGKVYGPNKSGVDMTDNMPRFEQGTMASSSTTGLVGEYTGAQSNPEVISPLGKLKQILINNLKTASIFNVGDTQDIEKDSNSEVNKTYISTDINDQKTSESILAASKELTATKLISDIASTESSLDKSNKEIVNPLTAIGKAIGKSISTSIFNVGDTQSFENTSDSEDNNTYISNSSRNLRGLNVPKFASGGIVYGETLATVGEYAGAVHNPEVIAPLSKLKDMITPLTPDFGDVKFVIEQNQLVGILSKANDKNIYF